MAAGISLAGGRVSRHARFIAGFLPFFGTAGAAYAKDRQNTVPGTGVISGMAGHPVRLRNMSRNTYPHDLEPPLDGRVRFEPPPGRRSGGRGWWRFLPAAGVGVFTVGMLCVYGVSLRDVVVFAAYLVLAVLLPGVLLVRAAYRRDRTLVEELALGLCLGYALEVFAYIGARAVGAPLLVLAWPAAVYALFAGVPALRRHWRGGPRSRAPLWWSLSLALVAGYLVLWSALSFFRENALAWPALGTIYIDMPFHLTLIGELRHHMPPTVPMVAGEPLSYHWFVYTHFAASSWITGIDPIVLVLRLGMLPMMVALTFVIGMIGRCLSRSWIGGLLAVTGTIFMAMPNLYQGIDVGVFTLRTVQSWMSPTQTFGAMLFAPIVLFLTDFRRLRRERGTWALLGIFLVAVMGAKATYLPLLAAGLAAVVVVELVRRRRLCLISLAVLGGTVACLAYAQLVLFGRMKLGMHVDALSLPRINWGGLTGRDAGLAPAGSLLGIAGLYVCSWALEWAGVLGLLARPRLFLRPPVVLMLGIGVTGLGALLMLGHPHRSQLHFFWACYPYVTILAAYGLVVAYRRVRLPLGTVALVTVPAMVVVFLVRALWGVAVPLGPGHAETLLYTPYVALGLIMAMGSGALLLVLRNRRVAAGTLTVFMAAAMGLPAAWCTRIILAAFGGPRASDAPVAAPTAVPASAIPEGAFAAARWLRDHSQPEELVATNEHCRWGSTGPCDSRQFWVSALTERRVLVEGWAFAPRNYADWRPGIIPERQPFWDGDRLRTNDAVFRSPSPASIRELTGRYGVRWLFVHEGLTGAEPRIGDYAELRFRSGAYAVYGVAAGPAEAKPTP